MESEEKLYLIVSDGKDVSISEVSVSDLASYGPEWITFEQIKEPYTGLREDCLPILIRGRVVVPKPKTVVTEYEVE